MFLNKRNIEALALNRFEIVHLLNAKELKTLQENARHTAYYPLKNNEFGIEMHRINKGKRYEPVVQTLCKACSQAFADFSNKRAALFKIPKNKIWYKKMLLKPQALLSACLIIDGIVTLRNHNVVYELHPGDCIIMYGENLPELKASFPEETFLIAVRDKNRINHSKSSS